MEAVSIRSPGFQQRSRKTSLGLFIPATVMRPPKTLQASLPPSVDALIKNAFNLEFPL